MKIKKRSSQHKSLHFSQSKRRLTLSKSPQPLMSSPRIAYFRKQKHPKAQYVPQKNKICPSAVPQIIICTPNEHLFKQIKAFPLKFNILQYRKQDVCAEKKDILIITKIQQFSQHYKKYFNELYTSFSSLEWVIMSNAINNKQTQEEFNIEYQPIKFVFVKCVGEFINILNFRGERHVRQHKNLTYFNRIINFEAYLNDYTLILEEKLDQKINLLKEKRRRNTSQKPELWIVSQSQLHELQGLSYHFFFLTQRDIRNKTIQIPISEDNIIIYILLQNYDHILTLLQIKEHEQKLSKNDIKQLSNQSKNRDYHEKIIDKYFHGEIIYHLIQFQQETIALFKELTQHLVIVSMNRFPQCEKDNHIFNIYYGQRDPHDIFGYQFKEKVDNLQKTMGKINKYYQGIIQLKQKYKQIRSFMSQYTIIIYNVSLGTNIAKEIKYFTSKDTYQIRSLQGLNNFRSQKIILISKPLNNKKILINQQLNINFIEINAKQTDTILLHNKIARLIVKLNRQEIINHEKLKIKKILNFCSSLNIDKSILIDCKIINFRQILSTLADNNKYMMILSMDEYNQQKEKKLKQLQLIKNIVFQVYLQYGNQFILRNKNNKYNFYKKSQIIQKINNIQDSKCTENMLYFECQDKKKSDITYNRHHQKKENLSTPNLYKNHLQYHQQIIICLPKSVPLHSLVNRSSKFYNILIYNNIVQVKQLLNHLSSQYYAVIINTVQDFLHKNSKIDNYQYVRIKELSQILIREQIDLVIEKFNLIKKVNQFQKYHKELPAVLLYDENSPKQLAYIEKLNKIFKNTKIIMMTKKQFKNITKFYKISDITIYEMGKSEIQSKVTIKVNHIVQLFKLHMSPCIPYHQFTFQTLKFSMKQVFIKSYYQYVRSQKIKGKNKSEINFYQQISRNKSIIQKQYVLNEPGIVIVQSNDLNILNKKQKFSNDKKLIQLCINNMRKGNQICILISQNMFSQIKYYINVYNQETIWIIIVQDLKKCIIRQSNLIFIQYHQVQQTISKIIQEYRHFKTRILQLFHQKLFIQHQKETIKIIFKAQKQQKIQILQIVFNKNGKQFENRLLKNTILIKNVKLFKCTLIFLKQYMRNSIFSKKTFSIIKKKGQYQQICQSMLKIQNIDQTEEERQSIIQDQSHQSSLQQEENQLEVIFIVIKQHNKRFIEQTLSIIQEKCYSLVIYKEIEELLEYSQLQTAIFIVEDQDNIKFQDCIVVQSKESPLYFSPKLKNYLKAIRLYY